MDFASVIRHRLDELGIGQRELAAAADVTLSSWIRTFFTFHSRTAFRFSTR